MRDETTGLMTNFQHSDPHVADYQGKEVAFYEFASSYMKDLLAAALEKRGELKWELADDVNPLYLQHLAGEARVEVKPGQWDWREVRSGADSHGMDTSGMMLCIALIAGKIRFVPSAATST